MNMSFEFVNDMIVNRKLANTRFLLSENRNGRKGILIAKCMTVLQIYLLTIVFVCQKIVFNEGSWSWKSYE